MRKRTRHFPKHHRNPSLAIEVEEAPPRLVAMTLANDLAAAVKADPEERQELIDAALCVGQWLADQGVPGRWDKIKPADVLRCLDFLPPREREKFLFSLVALVGHAALFGQIAGREARRTLEEVVGLTQEDAIREFARKTSEQIDTMSA